MPISVKVINNLVKRISKTNNLLNMLLEFEDVLDTLDIYAFENWFKGELLEGPILKRHYVIVRLIYKHDEMPDPAAVKRLMARGCIVAYDKDVLITPKKVKTFADVEIKEQPDGKIRYMAKKQRDPVWVVTIEMPRHYVDKFQTDIIEADEDNFVDTEDMNVESEIDSGEQLRGDF